MSQTGRAATAASIEGGASNGVDYLTNPELDGKRNVSDFLQTASVLNETLKPDGDTGNDLRLDGWNGVFGGGEGPLPVGSHAG